MRRTVLLIFTLAVIIDLIALYLNLDYIRDYSKATLMPILAVYTFTIFKNRNTTIFKWLILALIFSWLGDLFLQYDQVMNQSFILGLGSFLAAHIFFIVTYFKSRTEKSTSLLTTQQARYLFIITMAGSGIIYILFPYLGALKLPVVVYASVLTYMSIAALYRYGRTTTRSFALVFGGAILFMMSDSMLAFNKFVGAFDYAGVLVMLTYAGAQLLIVKGLASHENEYNKTQS